MFAKMRQAFSTRKKEGKKQSKNAFGGFESGAFNHSATLPRRGFSILCTFPASGKRI
jgi:hypothetical protein